MPWTHAWSCAGTLLKLAAYLRQLTCSGAIAQLGERIVRNDEVVGSIPTSSTMFSITCGFPVVQFCPKLVQKFSRQPAGVCLNCHSRRNRIGELCFKLESAMAEIERF